MRKFFHKWKVEKKNKWAWCSHLYNPFPSNKGYGLKTKVMVYPLHKVEDKKFELRFWFWGLGMGMRIKGLVMILD